MAVKRAAAARGRSSERPAQRRRTRKAIVDAAMALLARGVTPSVADVAAAAEVSRRTIYMYFPTFDQLLLDATVGALSEPAVAQAAHGDEGEDIEAAAERLVRAIHRVSPETERLGRALIRLTVDAPAAEGTDAPRRGYRRMEWIESAMAPWRRALGAARWRRLVAGLAMVIGWEALIVQRDVAGLDAAAGEALSVWAARALARAAMDDATASGRRRAR